MDSYTFYCLTGTMVILLGLLTIYLFGFAAAKEKYNNNQAMNIELKWIPVGTQDPDDEVLAFGYQDNFLIGFLYKTEGGDWHCESGGEVLEMVTHFIHTKDIPQP